jgi:Ni/Fe-hydrogenase subunit HybB-like protein
LPTMTEIAVTIGIGAYALMGFSLGVKYLPIFTKHTSEVHE